MDNFGGILFEKLETLQRMYELINFFATQQFLIAYSCLCCYCDCKGLKIVQTAQINQLFQLLILADLYIWRRLLWVDFYARRQKCKQFTYRYQGISNKVECGPFPSFHEAKCKLFFASIKTENYFNSRSDHFCLQIWRT